MVLIDKIKYFIKDVWWAANLQKDLHGVDEEYGELARVLTSYDLYLFVIGIVTFSFYWELPVLISLYGYMIFIPIFVTGLIIYITTSCYEELMSVRPTSGGWYSYSYFAFGELMAFISGWSVIYITAIRFLHCVKGLTRLIDVTFFSGVLTDFTKEHMPIGGSDNYFLSVYSNARLETIFITAAFAGISTLHLKYLKIIINIASLLNLCIIGGCFLVFWFTTDMSTFNVAKNSKKDLTFFTEGAVQSHLFYNDFEVVLYAGQEAINPKVSLPYALRRGYKYGLMVYIILIFLYADMEVHHHDMRDFMPMETVLSRVVIRPFHLMPVFGVCLCFTISAVARLFVISRLLYTMSKDGMSLQIFGKVDKSRKNPLKTIIIASFLFGVIAVFVESDSTTFLAMIGMGNCMKIAMLISYLVLRYRCEISVTSTSARNHNHFDLTERWVLLNLPKPVRTPTTITHTISMWLIFLTVLTLTLSLFLVVVYIINLDYKNNFVRVVLLFSTSFFIIALILLHQQPQNKRKSLFKVYDVPFFPILAIGWHMLIILLLPDWTWVKALCWWLIGIIFYFSYACRRSKEYIKKSNSQKMSQEF